MDDKGNQLCRSAFRIVGKIEPEVVIDDNCFSPECHFDVGHDVNLVPAFQAVVDGIQPVV
jgi:hypothetical protein